MKNALILFLDWLGVAQTADVDERLADLSVAVAVLSSDLEDLKARLDEFDLSLAPGAEA